MTTTKQITHHRTTPRHPAPAAIASATSRSRGIRVARQPAIARHLPAPSPLSRAELRAIVMATLG